MPSLTPSPWNSKRSDPESIVEQGYPENQMRKQMSKRVRLVTGRSKVRRKKKRKRRKRHWDLSGGGLGDHLQEELNSDIQKSIPRGS